MTFELWVLTLINCPKITGAKAPVALVLNMPLRYDVCKLLSAVHGSSGTAALQRQLCCGNYATAALLPTLWLSIIDLTVRQDIKMKKITVLWGSRAC